MQGALSYARIILQLNAEDLEHVRRDEAFDAIVHWLAAWREDGTVDAAYRRLLGMLH